MFTSKKEAKKQLGEVLEKVDAMGQESELHAAKWVKEVGKQEEVEEKTEQDKLLEVLERKSRFAFSSYKQYLCQIMRDTMLNKTTLLGGWKYRTFFSDKGVGLMILSPEGRKFAKGFAPVNEPNYDLHACVSICLEAENTVDKMQAEKEATPVNGIYRV